MFRTNTPLTLSLTGLLLVAPLACNRKSEAQVQAEAAASAAEAKVAELQKRLEDAKTGKGTEGADAETKEHLTKGQMKALERQLADAKKRANAKKKEAETLTQAPASASASAPKPEVVDVPTGTSLIVKLAEDLATDKVQAGDAFEGTLSSSVMVDGKAVWPAGASVRGVVAQSVPAGRLQSGQGVLAIKLTEVAGEGIETEAYAIHGAATGERNAKYIGGGALLGALAGVLSDKRHQGDHALGGAALGAAAGTALAAGTANTVIKIDAASPISFKLAAPEKVTIKK